MGPMTESCLAYTHRLVVSMLCCPFIPFWVIYLRLHPDELRRVRQYLNGEDIELGPVQQNPFVSDRQRRIEEIDDRLSEARRNFLKFFRSTDQDEFWEAESKISCSVRQNFGNLILINWCNWSRTKIKTFSSKTICKFLFETYPRVRCSRHLKEKVKRARWIRCDKYRYAFCDLRTFWSLQSTVKISLWKREILLKFTE